jgi:hypothetical protein
MGAQSNALLECGLQRKAVIRRIALELDVATLSVGAILGDGFETLQAALTHSGSGLGIFGRGGQGLGGVAAQSLPNEGGISCYYALAPSLSDLFWGVPGGGRGVCGGVRSKNQLKATR